MLDDEKIKILSTIMRTYFNNKNKFIEFLNDSFSIIIPKSYTYKKIFFKINDVGLEEKLCNIFNSKNYLDLIHIYYNQVLLSFLDLDELKGIAAGNEKISVQVKTRDDYIDIISRNYAEEELIGKILDSRTKDTDKKIIERSGYWVLGPLGLLKSDFYKSRYETEYYLDLFYKYLPNPDKFKNYFKELSNYDKDVLNKGPYIKEKYYQAILTSLNYDDILKKFNKMMNDEKINVQDIDILDDIIITPYGFFEKEYDGYNNIVKLLLNNFSENELDVVLRSAGLIEGSFETRVCEFCLIRNPITILETFFGTGPHLINISNKMNLVSLKEIRNYQILLNTILLKLGFSLPPFLEGLSSFSLMLKSYYEHLMNDIKDEKQLGMWNKIYSRTENILRDIIYFFYHVLWEKELEEYHWKSEIILRKLQENIKKEFKLVKPITLLTFGELCGLMSQINKKISNNDDVYDKVNKLLHKDHILRKKDIKVLNAMASSRTVLTQIHFTKRKKVNSSSDVLNKLMNMVNEWLSLKGYERVYPIMVRLKEEIENEFGIRYIKVIDEYEKEYVIKKSDFWMESTHSYYMLSETERLIIEPILIKKIW